MKFQFQRKFWWDTNSIIPNDIRQTKYDEYKIVCVSDFFFVCVCMWWLIVPNFIKICHNLMNFKSRNSCWELALDGCHSFKWDIDIVTNVYWLHKNQRYSTMTSYAFSSMAHQLWSIYYYKKINHFWKCAAHRQRSN